MPLRRGHNYYRWGNSRTKYYFDNEYERRRAKQRAILQGYAIEKSEERAGKPSELVRSGTGRKTMLRGIGHKKSRTKSRSGSKTGRPKSRSSKRQIY
jgi:hypothetical protein